MLKPELRHFERSALEIAEHGDNDTLPFDVDTRFCRDEGAALAQIAYGFYSELRDSKSVKENHERIAALHVYSERLLAPSGPSGFRVITKMHLFWNIYLNGLAIAIAETLEPERSNAARSYRFLLGGDKDLFDSAFTWRAFKEETAKQAAPLPEHAVVVQTDISSFYEHVSHHYIENIINGLDGDGPVVSKQVNALLSKLFAGRSFGLPVGGQGARILAELFLHQVDMALRAKGFHGCRYVDDYVLIADNTADAYQKLGVLAQCLMDYGLSLNKSKTVLLSAKHYCDYVASQLGGDDAEAAKLRKIDLKFDPYSDSPEQDYDSLVETVETLEVRKLLNRELEKALPDTFLVTQIGRTIRLHEPAVALEIAATLLKQQNLHAFRSSFSTIMRGIANLRGDERFAAIHDAVDRLLDALPNHSAHLLKAETSLLHYLRCLRLKKTPARATFVSELFDKVQVDAVRRACLDCWRGWNDAVAFNHLRNRWQQLSPECQRLYWLSSHRFGDEGNMARLQARRAVAQYWQLGVEVDLDEERDKSKLAKHPRGAEPRFANVFQNWAKGAGDAV
ncbi:RNA-directed DNA polymerase [Roseateles noduli]|uniref:RNA-directed DNA polymerase n=1 Tax=Roseateles noduli TaxID=2052484 RepID=UPI003D65DB54